ncbi:hypothetical protein [Rodentibacter trehalosifermentans]|uniref:hypothetical protein n=1 Tax=Rodentibacter trehalosifermentans TaxID=1908263 RepID=UPI0009875B1B|nr:hypothetical protein [Rodentibacter trehalosifermentans]OOF52735.1 hypothetical protein BKK53_03840 [Rodentibacter trehalosifermentans]
MSELINIPKSEYINLLNDKQRLNFIENTGITIISFKKRWLAARDGIGLFVERESLRETIDDAIRDLEND